MPRAERMVLHAIRAHLAEFGIVAPSGAFFATQEFSATAVGSIHEQCQRRRKIGSASYLNLTFTPGGFGCTILNRQFTANERKLTMLIRAITGGGLPCRLQQETPNE
jgi:hypothetical protein